VKPLWATVHSKKAVNKGVDHDRVEGEELQKLQSYHMSAIQALTNRRVWQLGLPALAWDIGLYWMSFWMPHVLKSLSSLYFNTLVGFLVVISQLVGLEGMHLS
jgi:ACS family tartrate transporter-like MFS transporter